LIHEGRACSGKFPVTARLWLALGIMKGLIFPLLSTIFAARERAESAAWHADG
jgi:hypothetical protein